MGSGKSTVGPIIAKSIGYGFVDLDAEIERRHGKTITSLFNELDEPGFRVIETSELTRVGKDDRVVVSTGGGIVTVEEHNRVGGLGSRVASEVVKDKPVPMRFVAVEDTFGRSGDVEGLFHRFGLTTDNIIEKTREIIHGREG